MAGLVAVVSERIGVDVTDLPRIIANALVTLGYRSESYDRQDNKIIYFDQHEETYGTDSWRCLYRVIVSWTEVTDGADITIKVKEKNYGNDYIEECGERAEQILAEFLRVLRRTKNAPMAKSRWTAAFASANELTHAQYFAAENEECRSLSRKFLLGAHSGTKVWLPERLSHRHVLVCGPTGSGKSTAIFIPNLLERIAASAIVTEAIPGANAPVLYQATAGWRHAAGHEIVYFNPADLHSARLNPIDLVRSYDDALHLASLIISNTTADTHMGDQIWGQSETHLLTSLILHAVGQKTDIRRPSQKGDNANLGYIRQILRKGPHALMEEFENTRIELARHEYQAYLENSSPNFRFGVMSGLMSRLALFVNPKVAALTEVTDVDLSALAGKLFTLYLAVPVERPELTPLAALMFNFAMSFVLHNLGRLQHPLMMLLDEFTNFGYLPGFHRYMATVRNAGIGMAIGVQDLAQLEHLYKADLAKILFSQPRTKLFFSPADDQLAFRISKMLGTTTEIEPLTPSGQISNREIPIPLMDGPEIMQLELEGKYLSIGQIKPIKLDMLSSWRCYAEQLKHQPPARPVVEVSNELQWKCRQSAEAPSWKATADQETAAYKQQKSKSNKKRGTPKSPASSEPTDSAGNTSYWDELKDRFN